jgi:hypothetical protein
VTIAAPGWTFEAQLEEVRARDPLWMRNFKMAKPLKHRRGTVRPSTAYHEAGHAVAAFSPADRSPWFCRAAGASWEPRPGDRVVLEEHGLGSRRVP